VPLISGDHPPIWLPPAPAIIRPANDLRLPPPILGMAALPWGYGSQRWVPTKRPIQVAASVAGTGGISSTHTVTIPGTFAAGDILVVDFSLGSPTGTITFPGDWTDLHATISSGVNAKAAYRIADGSEGASITVTLSAGRVSNWVSYRISDTAGVAPEAATATGTSTTPDPPNLAPSWGAANTIWIAGCSSGVTGTTTVTGYPSGYTNNLNESTGNGLIGTSQKNSTASSENPGTFTISASQSWSAVTIGVKG